MSLMYTQPFYVHVLYMYVPLSGRLRANIARSCIGAGGCKFTNDIQHTGNVHVQVAGGSPPYLEFQKPKIGEIKKNKLVEQLLPATEMGKWIVNKLQPQKSPSSL